MKTTQKNKIQLSIIKTLAYADVFDFPMKNWEIWKYYISGQKVSHKILSGFLESMVESGLIGRINNYYFLKGRQVLVKIRCAREKESRLKINIARETCRLLSLIPWLKLIGISGSLSMMNAKKADDIDLFIVTEKHALWIVRFMVNMVLILRKIKRSRNDSYGINLVCPNMFVAVDNLCLPREKHNLFSAHEVAQVKVLLNRDQTYELFMKANVWVKACLPNLKTVSNTRKNSNNISFLLVPLNLIFYFLQFMYMKRKITKEEVKINIARFHPNDKSSFVQTVYKLRLSRCLSFVAPASARYSRILTYSFV